MMSGLDHLHMKIGRAEKHLREFDGLVVDHARRPDPYSITEKDDTDSGRYIIRVEYSLIDGDVPLSLGDFVYNLKSLQPYQRGNAFRDHPLWHLNELSNIDKHRTPGGRAHDGGFYDGAAAKCLAQKRLR